MSRGRVLSKAAWIEALGERIDEFCHISRAQYWLESCMEYYSPHVPDEKRLNADDIVDVIHRRAREEVAERRPHSREDILYLDYELSPSEAQMFAIDLVRICRHIGGDDVGDAVYGLAFADRSAIQRYTLDFLSEVFTPLYSRIDNALRYQDWIEFHLGNVKIVATPLAMGRSWLSISRDYRDEGRKQHVVISLSGGSFKPDGTGLGLNGARGGSLASILRTLELATRAYQALDEEGKDALFAKYRVPVNV